MRLDGHTVEISNTDKPFFPKVGITKGDVVDYYRRVAEFMLPHLRARPLTLQRFPDGIDDEGFYQKDMPDYFPGWIHHITLDKEDGRVTHVVADDAATLVYLANQGVITFHVWPARRSKTHHPDRLIFDLDPPGDDFTPVRRAALALRGKLEELDLASFVMTTGSQGVHVVVPLQPTTTFDQVRTFARELAGDLVAKYPDALTLEQRKDKRGGRVFIDYLRNSYGQTHVAPYSLRPLPAAPVATPVDWSELSSGKLGPRTYTLKNLFRRLGQKQDPWRELDDNATSLPPTR